MKIAKRIGILILLATCLLAIERGNIIQAKTNSCPERDQCYDDANAGYNSCIDQANEEYSVCGQAANDRFSECTSDARQAQNECRSRADANFRDREDDCFYDYLVYSDYPDSSGYDYCVSDAYDARQRDYQSCFRDYDNTIDGCNDERAEFNAFCTANFYSRSNPCTTKRNNDWRQCDLLCPGL